MSGFIVGAALTYVLIRFGFKKVCKSIAKGLRAAIDCATESEENQ